MPNLCDQFYEFSPQFDSRFSTNTNTTEFEKSKNQVQNQQLPNSQWQASHPYSRSINIYTHTNNQTPFGCFPPLLSYFSPNPAVLPMQSNNIQTYNFGNNQEVPRTLISPHNRASSLSSLGSAGPESPYTTTISPPYVMGDFDLNDLCPFPPHEIFSPVEQSKQQQEQQNQRQRQQTVGHNSCFPFPMSIIDQEVECAPQPYIFNNVHLSQRPSEVSTPQPLMESRGGEYEPEAKKTELQKPAKVSANTGTYTCTYHGCTLRFDTPARLQRHKREGHRSSSAAAVAASTLSGLGCHGMTSLAHRNSQAGPHKCERINPSTGKPCNTVFSRPYDLTRHEDTIHNTQKQKVHCPICEDEKSFSRNDALTRHMRVVHPEYVDTTSRRRRGPSG